MQIKIDTEKDSPDEIKRIISFLESVIAKKTNSFTRQNTSFSQNNTSFQETRSPVNQNNISQNNYAPNQQEKTGSPFNMLDNNTSKQETQSPDNDGVFNIFTDDKPKYQESKLATEIYSLNNAKAEYEKKHSKESFSLNDELNKPVQDDDKEKNNKFKFETF
eukprot:TRINITY_DN12587_c0_g1_i1.p3 TRINITY_DN12587_c0_g1~~TRINITY_DN12587_c0_g1_i1.p3  ORF type:complete len:162 (+),score=18.22 TRINITY_DN12587_c0_g1_i1:1550-2035(+)